MTRSPSIRVLLLLATALASRSATAQSITTPLAGAPANQPAPSDPAKPRKPRTPRPPKSEAAQLNPNLIVLDPAHGGADAGAKLGETSLEKDATIALANLLKARLEAKGFTVALTHTNSSDETPQDARIELANRSHAVACLLLHASNGGHGVHLYTSALSPNHPSLTAGEPAELAEILPWDTAQARILPQSMRLSSDLVTSFNSSRIPLVTGQASVKPMDSLNCPAVALELAPSQNALASDPEYQSRIADSVTQALVLWRGHVIALAAAATAARGGTVPAAPDAAKPAPKIRPKPTPKPAKIPSETPLDMPAPTPPGTAP